uniref:Uncharacterized protein n=1 Tax=Parascaris equorum TaxID=6256 RepID=A0A914SE07_PAREQ
MGCFQSRIAAFNALQAYKNKQGGDTESAIIQIDTTFH